MFICNKQQFKECSDKGQKTFSFVPLPGKADNVVDFKKALEI
jgi:hypothetical protein